jgi:hypothetical protein
MVWKYCPKTDRMIEVKNKPKKKKTAEDLALEFAINQEQMKGSTGKLRKAFEKERDIIVKKYKKLNKVI